MASLSGRALAFGRDVAAFAGIRGVEASLFVAMGAVLEGAGILLLIPLLSTLFAGAADTAPPWLTFLTTGAGAAGSLTVPLALFGAVMVLRALVLWRRDLLLGRLQVGFVETRRRAIAHRLAETRWEALARLGHGRVTHVMSGDVQRCGAGVHFLLQGGVAVVMIGVQTGLALAMAPRLTAFALILLALGALAMSVLFRDANAAGARVTSANLALMTGLGRFLGGMKMAMSQNLQGAFVKAFDQELADASRQQTAFIGQQSVMRGLWSLTGAAAAGATVIVGYSVLHLAPAVLVALLVLLARIGGPASQLQLGLQQIAYSLPAWEAVKSLDQDLAASARPPLPGTRHPRLSGPIVFSGVTWRHGEADHSPGVHDIDWRIEPGAFVGVRGPSGGGKTTLADLLAGLLVPRTGQVSVGDTAMDEHAARAWRDQVAYVAQDPVLFNDTLRNNLLWAKPDATVEELDHALRLSGADRLAAALPSGLDTVMGEAGALISGGERQRIALSRALLRRPDLLVLDEATSALDLESERAILERLRTLDPRPTVVLIAHRGESFAFCDSVVSVVDGRLTGGGAQ